MNPIEAGRALKKLGLSGMAEHLEIRILEAQTSRLAPIDFLALLLSDEMQRRADRLIERRIKQARFRDADRSLDNFDFDLEQEDESRRRLRARDRALPVEGGGRALPRPARHREEPTRPRDRAVILQGWEVAYREVHVLLEELADATLDGTRKDYLKRMRKAPLLIIDDLGLRQLPKTAAEDLLELVMRRYERTSTLFTSNRAVDEWAKLLGDTTATSALLDRLLHHAHVVQCGPKSYRMLRRSRETVSA